jgi:hypothetical protein
MKNNKVPPLKVATKNSLAAQKLNSKETLKIGKSNSSK